jgi:hypothetical protein
MGTRLLDFVWTRLTWQPHELMLILERSIRRNGQHRDAAAAVVGYDQKLAGRVDGLANAIVPSRGAPIQ